MATPETVSAVREFVRECLKRLAELDGDSPEEWTEVPRWVRGSDGHYRKYSGLSRELQTSRLHRELASLPGYERLQSLLAADALIGPHLNTLVGGRYSSRRFEVSNLIFSLIRRMLDVTGSLEFRQENFGPAWALLNASLQVDQISTKTIAAVPGLTLPDGKISLNDEVEFDLFSDEEVTRCERLGILRPSMPEFPMIRAEEAIGIRRTTTEKKVIGEQERALPMDFGRFGARDPLHANILVEDVMCLLRLYKPCSLRCAGHVTFIDWEWLAGGSAFQAANPNVTGLRYEIAASDGLALRELWALLVKVARGFEFSLRRFNLAFDRESLEDRIVDLVIAAESLFLGDVNVQDRGELRFRFALRAAWFIEHPESGRRAVFAMMRRAYDARSAIVHGGVPSDTRTPGNETASIVDFARSLQELVRLALRKSLTMAAGGVNVRGSEFWTNLVLPE